MPRASRKQLKLGLTSGSSLSYIPRAPSQIAVAMGSVVVRWLMGRARAPDARAAHERPVRESVLATMEARLVCYRLAFDELRRAASLAQEWPA